MNSMTQRSSSCVITLCRVCSTGTSRPRRCPHCSPRCAAIPWPGALSSSRSSTPSCDRPNCPSPRISEPPARRSPAESRRESPRMTPWTPSSPRSTATLLRATAGSSLRSSPDGTSSPRASSESGIPTSHSRSTPTRPTHVSTSITSRHSMTSTSSSSSSRSTRTTTSDYAALPIAWPRRCAWTSRSCPGTTRSR